MSHAPIDYLEVRYRIKDSGADWTVARFAPNGFSLRGLSGGQTYEVQGRNVGTDGQASEWTAKEILVPANANVPNINDVANGVISKSATSTNPGASAEVITDAFEPSGASRTVRVDYSYWAIKPPATGSDTAGMTAQNVTGVIEVFDGSTWTQIGGWSANGYYTVESESGFVSYESNAVGSGMASDTTVGTVQYRARMTGNTLSLISGVTNTATLSIRVEQ